MLCTGVRRPLALCLLHLFAKPLYARVAQSSQYPFAPVQPGKMNEGNQLPRASTPSAPRAFSLISKRTMVWFPDHLRASSCSWSVIGESTCEESFRDEVQFVKTTIMSKEVRNTNKQRFDKKKHQFRLVLYIKT